MAVAYGSATEATFNNVSDWSIPVPSGTAIGDFLVCWAAVSVDTGTFGAPAAWFRTQATDDALDCILGVAWIVATSTETSGSIAFTWSGTRTGSAVLIRYTGAHADAQIDPAWGFASQASGTAWTGPTITTDDNGAMIVVAATNDGASGHTDPQYSSWLVAGSAATERHDFRDATTFQTLGVADYLQASQGAASTAVTRVEADVGMMGGLFVKPAGAPPPPGVYMPKALQALSAVPRAAGW